MIGVVHNSPFPMDCGVRLRSFFLFDGFGSSPKKGDKNKDTPGCLLRGNGFSDPLDGHVITKPPA